MLLWTGEELEDMVSGRETNPGTPPSSPPVGRRRKMPDGEAVRLSQILRDLQSSLDEAGTEHHSQTQCPGLSRFRATVNSLVRGQLC